MYSTVKAVAAASVIVVISIQPGADAARAPFSSTVQRLDRQLSSPMFSPYADPMAGIFQPGGGAAEHLANLFVPQPRVGLAAPEPLLKLPEYPAIERLEPEVPGSEQAVVVPEPAKPDLAIPEATMPALPPTPPVAVAPPVVIIPLPPVREAVVAPPAPAPKALLREVPARRAARTAPRADLIAFDGPAGAPFAHTRFCLKYPAECRVQKQKLKFRGGPIELTAERRLEMVRVNAEVNRSIVGTRMNEPVANEQWVISPKLGDCNDYAVTKRHKLLASGFPARSLLLAEVVTTWGEHHLVLVVRTRQGDLVLDNLNANLNNWTKTPYQWVRIESPVNPLYWAKLKAPQPDVMAMNGTGRRL